MFLIAAVQSAVASYARRMAYFISHADFIIIWPGCRISSRDSRQIKLGNSSEICSAHNGLEHSPFFHANRRLNQRRFWIMYARLTERL